VDEIYYCNETADPSFVFVSTTTTKSKQKNITFKEEERE